MSQNQQPANSNSPLSFEVNEGDIKLSGFIDRFTVNTLIKSIDLTKISIEQLNIDFSGVEKVDTAGLAWILKVMAQARQSGQTVHLSAMPAQLVNLAEISGVEQLLVSV